MLNKTVGSVCGSRRRTIGTVTVSSKGPATSVAVVPEGFVPLGDGRPGEDLRARSDSLPQELRLINTCYDPGRI